MADVATNNNVTSVSYMVGQVSVFEKASYSFLHAGFLCVDLYMLVVLPSITYFFSALLLVAFLLEKLIGLPVNSHTVP